MAVMEQGNVEIVRRAFAKWVEGDLHAMADHFQPELVVQPPSGWPEGGVVEGIEAWVRQAERLRENWGEVGVQFDEIREVEEGRVYARIRYLARSDAGMEFDTPMAVAMFLRDGRIFRAEYYWQPEEALAAIESTG
jgi:ketosteroid isomerase-like protein